MIRQLPIASKMPTVESKPHRSGTVVLDRRRHANLFDRTKVFAVRDEQELGSRGIRIRVVLDAMRRADEERLSTLETKLLENQ